MKTKSFTMRVILVYFTVSLMGLIWTSGEDEISLVDMEIYLKSSEIITAIPDENLGRTEPWRVELDDETVKRRAMFKHVSRCRPHMLPDCYKYEIAAYELSKLLRLNIVPPTVSREIKGIPGSLQMFLEDCVSLQTIQRRNLELPDPDKFEKSILDINVFENLTYCPFDEEDIWVHFEDGKVYRVDFSEAFAPHHELTPECKISQSSQELYENLVNLSEAEVKTHLSNYLNEQEIEALIVRKSLIIDALEKEQNKDAQKLGNIP